MWDFFGRRKKEKLFSDLMRAAAEGHARSTVHRSLATLNVRQDRDEEDAKYISRGCSAILGMAKKEANLEPGSEVDIWLDGILLMVFANHLSYLMETDFEASSTLALVELCGIRESEEIVEIIHSYNQMSAQESKVITALGISCARWVDTPNEESSKKLGQLYSLLHHEGTNSDR